MVPGGVCHLKSCEVKKIRVEYDSDSEEEVLSIGHPRLTGSTLSVTAFVQSAARVESTEITFPTVHKCGSALKMG